MNKKKKKMYLFFAGIAIFLCVKTGYDMWEISFRGIDKATQILFLDRYHQLWSGREDITFSFNRDCGNTTAKFEDKGMRAMIKTKNGFIHAEECRLKGDEQLFFAKKITSSKSAYYYPSEPDSIDVSWVGGDYTIYPEKKINEKEEVQELNDEDYQLIEFFHTADVQFRLLLGDVRSVVLKMQAVILMVFIALVGMFLKLACLKKKNLPEI